MQFIYRTELKDEITSLIATLRFIMSGKYARDRFFLTDKQEKAPTMIVKLPKITKEYIAKHKKEIVGFIKLPQDQKDILIQEFKQLLEKQYKPIDITNYPEITKIEQNSNEIENVIKVLFPIKEKEIKVIVKLCRYSTGARFGTILVKDNQIEIYVLVRVDSDYKSLTKVIFMVLMQHFIVGTWENNWRNNINAIDVLFKTKLFENIDTEKKSTLDQLDNLQYNEDDFIRSKELYKDLGYPIESLLSLDKDKILIENKRVLKGLTAQESKVLELLISKRNTVILWDELGDIIWEDKANDKYSLWALNKVIQRIRKKLKDKGIEPHLLLTIKGKGVVLYD